jgi:hypothetical protein
LESQRDPAPWEDARGHVFKYEFQVARKAPEVWDVLADLVHRGELPMGRYLIHCWW